MEVKKMMQNANNITLKHKRKKIWQKFVLFLCSAVVFCTTYALILPAITMEDKTICGAVEHLHDESCYSVSDDTKELICSEVSDHLHDESCYHELDVLIDVLVCDDQSHEHNEACFTKEIKQELDCDIVHDHTDE